MASSKPSQPSAALCGSMAAYGVLGLPLAMAALPIYLQAPKYYSDSLGVPLALIGWVLFLARAIDTLQEPFIGQWLDRLAHRQRLPLALWLATLLLALAFTGIWMPSRQWGAVGLAVWLGAMLALAYSAHSVLQIAYLAWGARLGSPAVQQQAAAWREGLGLVGIVLASTVGIWLLQQSQTRWALPVYAVLFGVLLALGVALLLHMAPAWQGQRQSQPASLFAAWQVRGFRQVLLPFFFNALSVALPATLVLFFIADRLQAQRYAPVFLTLYFLAGAISLRWWNRLAARIGMVRAWRMGMVLAMLGFAISPWLGPATAWLFAVVCVATGWAVGADLVLPPVLLGSRIPAQAQPAGFYGVSSLLGKLALASSALALPLLAQLGYVPGEPSAGTVWLAWLYAGLPCFFKLMAWRNLRHAETIRTVS